MEIPNVQSFLQNGFTCLHIAAQEGCTDVVEYLLHKGIDRHIKASNGKTAQEIASTSELANIIKNYGKGSPSKPSCLGGKRNK